MSVRPRAFVLPLFANGRSLAAALLAGCLAWLPEACWIPAIRAATKLRAKIGGKRRHWTGREARHWLSVLPALRTYRPGGWRIETKVAGAEHLDHALAEGRGAILWVHRQPNVPHLAGIVALSLAGYHIQQLTRPGHGFGGTPFQRRWLNPPLLRVEARWLAGHVFFAPGAELAALRLLRTVLAANGVISILALRGPARKHSTVEFEGEPWRFPTGPVSLARQTGAALLPTFLARTSDGRFVIEVESPLPVTGRDDPAPFVAFAVAIRRHFPADQSWILRHVGSEPDGSRGPASVVSPNEL